MQRWSFRLTQTLRTFLRRGVLLVLHKASLAVISVVAVLTLTLSPMLTKPASAAITDFGLGGNSCAIETVGWVICPTMRSIARLADKGFTYINQSSLSVNYKLFGNSGKTFTAWEVMRNIANALFVVVFLYIIYGYLTGRTGGTYSIKRLLPRLLIAAIAINLSYYLGVILIDISNIIGDSIWTVMKNIYGNGSPVMPLGISANPLNDGNLTKMTAAALGNTGMVWVLLPPIAAVTITVAVISAVMVILIIMREAIIAALILAAPLLIAFQLLPNVERLSNQAMRLFLQLLLLYPIIALLLGTGQIVSLAAGGWDNQSAPYGGGTMSIVPDLVAAAAAVTPLLGIWFIFKNMSSIMSTAGSRLSASIRSRRGEEDKNARVTGKASIGAANAKNATGLGRIMGRRQAFSRNRRRSSIAGSALTGEDAPNPNAGLANRQPPTNPNAAQNALDAASRANATNSEDEAKRLEDLQNARIEGQADGIDAETALAAAADMNGKGGKQDEKHVTAKDLFNSMNQAHESKDKDRKLSAGGPGLAAGTAQAASQPAAPSTSYRAPSMAQNNNIVQGGASSAPPQVIAVPVQVDASSLLGQQNSHMPDNNAGQPPISMTEEKAKARAQKYLYESDQDIEKARDAADILGHKKDAPTEQPHTSANHEGNKETENKDQK